MSATYTKSLTGNREDRFGAPIAATLMMPFSFGQWTLVLADVFSFSNDPLESTFGTERTTVDQYSNTASLSTTRRFGRGALTFAAQRIDRIFPDDPDQDEVIHSVSITPAFFFRENYSVFLRTTYGITELEDATKRDSWGYSSEIGLSGQITPSIVGSVSVGWSHSELEATETEPVDNVDGLSSNFALNYAHPLRPNTAHSISVLRSPGVTALLKEANIQEVTAITYALAHRLNPQITLAPTVSWTHLRALSGTAEKTDIIAVGLGFSRRLTKKLTMTFTYRYQTRSSNIPMGNYDVNRLAVTANYTF